jgi:hypothetical protein
MGAGILNTTRDLLITAIDLTRACCAHENYLAWLSIHRCFLPGSADIVNYFANAAIAFEEQAHPTLFADFEAFDARDNLADILMASAPLTSEELRTAVSHAIHEARSEQVARMTRITRKLVRVTTAKFRGDEIVIELHATAVFVRSKGSRESFPIPYADLYEIAAMRYAKRVSGFAGKPRVER